MTDSTLAEASTVFTDSIIIDACAIVAHEWHERMELSGATALQIAITWPHDDTAQALRRIQKQLGVIRADERFVHVKSVQDIERCKAEGLVGHILSTQATDLLGRDASLVEVFYGAGLRVMQLVYNERNLSADGCMETTNAGLSFFGREVVAAMNESGMVLDLNDTSINSSLEALELSSKPCIFSRVNPRATALEQQHNLTDEQIRALGRNGGVVGLIPYGPLCATTPGEHPSVADYIRHIEHVVDLVGIDHVGIGTDSEASPGGVSPELSFQMGHIGRLGRGAKGNMGEISEATGMRKARTKPMSYFEMVTALQNGNWGATGFENLSKMPALVDALVAKGWADAHIAQLLGGNFMRVYGQNWK